ncbi:MAG TPA: hypothetical protein VIC26_11155 [Marinagarivorans sp.]
MKHLVWIVIAIVAAYFLLNKPYPSEITVLNQTFSDPTDKNDSGNDLILALYRSTETGDLLFVGRSEDSAVSSASLYERYRQIYAAQGYKLQDDGRKTIGNDGKATIYLYRSNVYKGIATFVTADESRPRKLSEAAHIFDGLSLLEF